MHLKAIVKVMHLGGVGFLRIQGTHYDVRICCSVKSAPYKFKRHVLEPVPLFDLYKTSANVDSL